MANRRSVPLTPKQAAARLSITVAGLPRSGAWTRQQVKDLRAERPEWLTTARKAYAARQDAKTERQRLARERWLAGQRLNDCFCCKTEFRFTAGSGGLCETCNEGGCPDCGDEWAYG